jgi:hypothetical protein
MLLAVESRDDFRLLAQLAASLSDAHSCALFLPTEVASSTTGASRRSSALKSSSGNPLGLRASIHSEAAVDSQLGSIDLVAVHSYSKLVSDCRIPVGNGLLGWVADQGRPIHLSPFEVGSSAIGIYLDSEPIRSLVAVPIFLTPPGSATRLPTCGVLMCDSLNAQAFPNSHVKLLEQVASLAGRLVYWAHSATQVMHVEASWDLFKSKTAELGEAIGHASVEILRLTVETFSELQSTSGISVAVQLSEQFSRLAQQALPPHFPLVKLPNGDTLVAVDNMMSAFFQQKLHSLAAHLHTRQRPFSIAIERYSAQLGPHGHCNLDRTLQQKPITVQTSSTAGGTRG